MWCICVLACLFHILLFLPYFFGLFSPFKWDHDKSPLWNIDLSTVDRACPTFGLPGPHWKKKSCLGPHIKYTNTNKNWWAKKKKVLSKFTVLCGAAFIDSHPALHAARGLWVGHSRQEIPCKDETKPPQTEDCSKPPQRVAFISGSEEEDPGTRNLEQKMPSSAPCSPPHTSFPPYCYGWTLMIAKSEGQWRK